LKAFLTVALFLILAASGLGAVTPHRGAADPCDGYGDCVSSYISYTRSNLDYTLYLGDGFIISLSIGTGSNTSG